MSFIYKFLRDHNKIKQFKHKRQLFINKLISKMLRFIAIN